MSMEPAAGQVRRADGTHPGDTGRLPRDLDTVGAAAAHGVPAQLPTRPDAHPGGAELGGDGRREVTFGIGPHALLTGTAYLDKDMALPFAQEALEDLREETGQTAISLAGTRRTCLYLATRESREAHHIIPRVGRRLPAHVTALGQVLLAQLTDDEVAALIPKPLAPITDHTITDPAELTGELDKIRARGWAYEREQGTPGVAAWRSRSITGSRPRTRSAARCPRAWRPPTWKVTDAVIRHTHKLGATLRREGIR